MGMHGFCSIAIADNTTQHTMRCYLANDALMNRCVSAIYLGMRAQRLSLAATATVSTRKLQSGAFGRAG